LKVISGIVLISAVLSYGFYRIEHVKRQMASLPVQEVSLIQGNVDQTVKWNPRFQKQTMSDYAFLTLKSVSSDGQLVVWPETAAPFFFQDRNDLHDSIIDLSRHTKSWLLFGSPSYIEDQSKMTLFNSAYLLSPEGEHVSKYDKVHLVPYGEYVPLRQIFPFISKLVQGVGDFGTGKGYIPLIMDGHKIGVLICYEGIFPEASRSYKGHGADLLVNITNDAWFGRTSAPYQHLSMTVFRAVENRLYLVRAANTGISAMIDPTGHIALRTNLFEKTAVQGKVRFLACRTFYGVWGDVFVLACGVLLILIVIVAAKRRNVK
jgi:apolipoprotein N-acyltransferase